MGDMAILLELDWAQSACFDLPPTRSDELTEIQIQPLMNEFVVTLQLTAANFQVCIALVCLFERACFIKTKLTNGQNTGLRGQQVVRSAPAMTKAAIQDFITKWHRRRNEGLHDGKHQKTIVSKARCLCFLTRQRLDPLFATSAFIFWEAKDLHS